MPCLCASELQPIYNEMSQWRVFNNEFRQVGEGEPAGASPHRRRRRLDHCLLKTKTYLYLASTCYRFSDTLMTRYGVLLDP